MNGGREAILASVRSALARKGGDAERRAALEARIAAHSRNLLPRRALVDHASCVKLFIEMAQKAAATVTKVSRLAEVPAAAADFLATQNLPAALRLAPHPVLASLPWTERPLMKIETGSAQRSDTASLTPAFAGIAETGTLMLISSPGTPTTLNFLPDNHLVVLGEAQVVGPFEDAWDRLRIAQKGAWPRTVNFITGPSRSADIEQQLHMGAHGPRRLHIILVGEGYGEEGQA